MEPIVDNKYQAMVKKAAKKHLRPMDIVFITVMLAGPLIYFCIFWLYVNVNSIFMAFQNAQGDWDLRTIQQALRDIFMSGGDLLIPMRNTLIFFLAGVCTLPFHVLIAYFLFRRVAGGKVIQVILYLPSIMSSVAIVTAFKSFINGPTSPLGIILNQAFGFELPVLLKMDKYAVWIILFYSLWIGWGGNMLLLGGALARVPLEVFESARLDGIGTFGEIFKMVVPLIWPTMSTLLILQMTGIFSASGPILLFTGGENQTSTIAFWIWAKVKYEGASAYNAVAASGLIFTCIGVPIILGVRKLIELVPTVEY